jgi:hypothetical protein
MRKKPIQAEPQYVLGEQLEDRGPAGEEAFCTSSNGDSWSLIRDQGEMAVSHVPNPASGGDAVQIDIEAFLSNGADGPEHQALRQLLEKTSNATILIAYDIHPAQGAAYDDLIGAIQSLGAWWHHLETVWIVRSNQKPDEIRDKLKSHIGTDDQLLSRCVSRTFACCPPGSSRRCATERWGPRKVTCQRLFATSSGAIAARSATGTRSRCAGLITASCTDEATNAPGGKATASTPWQSHPCSGGRAMPLTPLSMAQDTERDRRG